MFIISKGEPRLTRLQAIYQRHSDFFLLLILFVTFRVLALAALRPGGQVLDFSDFYWYRSFAELTHQGYYPYDNLWSPYPPLFSLVMVAIYQLSALLPPWTSPNLWFTLLLGGFFLLFEIGNFVLLYLFALKIASSPPRLIASPPPFSSPLPLRTCWIYAALFVPIYTLIGWFESYPLFFFLLSLYLLLQNRPYLSAFFTGVGLMIKLVPVILMPMVIQHLSKQRYQVEITNYKLQITRLPQNTTLSVDHSSSLIHNSQFRQRHAAGGTQASAIHNSQFIVPFDLPRTALYLAILLITIILITLPFYAMNPALILSSQQVNEARQPWETVWALIDGNYDYGIVPLDLRDLSWTPGHEQPTHVPWLLVTGVFGLVYLFFYTRPLNWAAPGQILPFVGFTLSMFFLWSKGYSPQWLGWPLFFIALLLPNLRGVIYATILSLANIIEANFFFIMFPEEHWLLAITVLIRTFLLIVLALECLGLIWPQTVTPRVEKVRAWGLALFVALLLLGAIPAGLQLSRSYVTSRLQQSPYHATITRLQSEQVKGALLLNSHTVYDWFFPYLHPDYSFFMLDDYAPPGQSVEARTTALLDSIAAQTDALWLYDADASITTPAEETLRHWLGDRPPAHIQDIDGGRLYLFILK